MDRQRQAILANGTHAGVGAAALAMHASSGELFADSRERGLEAYLRAVGASHPER